MLACYVLVVLASIIETMNIRKQNTQVEKFVRSFAEDPATLSVDSIGTFFEDVASGKLEPMPELDELDKLDDMDPEDELEDGEEGLDEEDIDEEKEEL